MTNPSKENYLKRLEVLKLLVEDADIVIVGAGRGFSESAGYGFNREIFEKNFYDFKEKYGINTIAEGSKYPFETDEEYWAYWSRYIRLLRYKESPRPLCENLYRLIQDKDYFVVTTNANHSFQRANFDRNRLFYVHGDYGLLQCSEPCHHKTYDNQDLIEEMVRRQENMKIPTDLLPHCPKCGKKMMINLRADESFVEDDGWHQAIKRYSDFIRSRIENRRLFIELGADLDTHSIIRRSFLQQIKENSDARYINMNTEELYVDKIMKDKSILFNEDIGKVLEDLLKD